MKRIVCLFLILPLLFSLSALADEGDYEAFESDLGFSIMYPDSLVIPYGEDDENCFRPIQDGTGANLVCRMAAPEDGVGWGNLGYSPMVPEAVTPDLDLALPWDYAGYVSDDGREWVEELVVQAAYGEYHFILTYPPEDPDEWGDVFRSMLETLEFPRQEAHAGSIDLLFDLNGDISYTDVVVDPEAEPVWLYPDAVTALVLEKVDWNDEYFTIADTETLFTGDFTGAECLRIFCYFPDGLPNLRVRCINRNGDRECWYLAESGRDGSLMLLDESSLHLADEDDDSF